MSICTTVFLRKSRMPEPTRWAAAIAARKFPMTMDTDFDVMTFSGFLPCSYDGRQAGFEYYCAAVDRDEIRDVVERIGDRDLMISFVTHSNFRELMTATIASGVLCIEADGVLWDTEAGDVFAASQAHEWMHNQIRSIEPELDDSDPQDEAAASNNNLDDRELCPDGACTGLIGPDGRCKVCGRSK